MCDVRAGLIWVGLALAVAAPIAAAATSPLLAWREPVYILGGFAGVLGMAMLLLQPLLAGGYLPGLSMARGRQLHRIGGAALLACVVIHVIALWITSPPDVIDVLLFRSPTPFSVWGVVAMWAVFATALLAMIRNRLRLRPRLWRMYHGSLAIVIVVGSVVHALLIEGTMETLTKIMLCALVLVVTAKLVIDLRLWRRRARRG